MEQVLAAPPMDATVPPQQSQPRKGIEVASIFVAVVAVVISGMSAYTAHKADNRVDRLENEQFANKVYLGEAPQYFYEDYKIDPSVVGPTWVVMNASGTEISRVWVESNDNTRINIQGIQRCTAYSLPKQLENGQEFVPAVVHFEDPYGSWKRNRYGPLETDNSEWQDSTDGISERPFDIKDCNG
ncbi:hypothetical protein [Rhodococcus aetherivorans]|uniref:hypothetical protein n=1 Tax=Rhodococcus aetherivorans TaxID=191292 RepID=UPI001260F907|nr:hypothetical protein [Rhodococcus aetherivorans]NGP29740.1 hypothetical protein [Rhodococcus aetherivorans]